jgi:hypothetical protein
MLGDGKWNSGNQGSFFKFNYGVLKLLEDINASIGALPGVDYETRTTTYVATAGGPGYSIGDIIVRYDIIDVATSTLSATVWFNQTTQTTIAAPAPGNITPYLPPGNVTVTNPFNLEATQILIKALLTTIDGDTSNLDVLLSTRNAEATQLLIKALLTTIDADTSNLDVALSTRNAEATQLLVKAKTDNLDVLLSTRNAEATQLLVKAKTDNLDVLLSTRASAVNQTNGTQTTQINNGANTAAVKAASTAAVATDPALVVAISPNNTVPISLVTTVRTPSLTRAVAAGSVAAGARSVSVYNAGTTAGTWLGASIEPGEQFSYDAGGQNDTLSAFAYTASATAILVITTIV